MGWLASSLHRFALWLFLEGPPARHFGPLGVICEESGSGLDIGVSSCGPPRRMPWSFWVDAHKRTHTFVAVDQVGRKLGERTVSATHEGHLDAITWSARWPDRQFTIEDCCHLTRLLESDLLAAGESVVRVPPQLMAGARRGGRQRGKSDPIDALAVARAALREPNLPVARLRSEEHMSELQSHSFISYAV